MRGPLDKKKAMKRFIVGQSIGGGVGGVLGLVPGLVAVIGGTTFGAFIGNNDSASLLLYLGLLVGSATGAAIGTIVTATQMVVETLLVAEESAIDEAASVGLPKRK